MARILSAVVLLAIVLAALFWLPPWGTLAVALLALVPAAVELAHLSEHGARPLPGGLLLVAAAAVLCSIGMEWFPLDVTLLAAFGATACVLVSEARPDVDVLRRAGVMVLPLVYLALPLGTMVAIRRERGPIVLLILLATTIVSDTAQYYGGRLMGRRPLAPRISPKKTVEGAICGLLVGSLVLPIAGHAALPGLPMWLLWPVGLAMVGLGIVGDLFESLLKRSVGTKDSSQLIPGHGGVLDRIDSLLLAAPFYYGFLRAVM